MFLIGDCLSLEESGDLWEFETSRMARNLIERGIKDDICFVTFIGALKDNGMDVLLETFQVELGKLHHLFLCL